MSLPTILAVDTATELCSVALLLGTRIFERTEAVGQKHSERVLPLIDSVLAEGGIRLSDVDAFAFGAGPGSFTGLRIACGVVQGLAYGCGRPVVGVGNLRALAAAGFSRQRPAHRALVAIDARMNEAYCAVYTNDESVSELRSPALEAPARLAAIGRETEVDLVVGNALSVFQDSWDPASAARGVADVAAGACFIAQLARLDLAHGAGVTAAQAMPVYVRDRVALTIDERRRKARQ